MLQKRPECSTCPLFNNTEVQYRGSFKAAVAFVGDTPNYDDENRNVSFTGKTGNRLFGEITKLGIPANDCVFLNSARCRIDKKNMSKKEINDTLKNCRPIFEKAVKKIKPKLIVAMGALAMQQVLKINRGVEKMKGKVLSSTEFGCPVLIMNHPSATLHDPAKYPQWQYHMSLVKEIRDKNYEINNEKTIVEYKEVQSIDFLLQKQNITVAFDTEHQGLDCHSKKFPMLCYSVTDTPGKGYVVWFIKEQPDLSKAKYTLPWKRGKDIVDVGLMGEPNIKQKVRELRELMARPDIKKIMHHGTFDLLVIEKILGPNYELNSWMMDTQNAAHLLDENLYVMPSLNQLANELTDMPFDQKMDLSQDIDKTDMLKHTRTEEGKQKITTYSAGDANSTLQIGLKLKSWMLQSENKRQANYYFKFLQPALTDVMWPMERQGVPINKKKLDAAAVTIKSNLLDFHEQCLQLIARHAPKIIKKHKEKGLKLTRRDIVRDFLFDRRIGYGIAPHSKNKKTEIPSTNKKDLIIIKDRDDLDPTISEFIDLYTKWGEYSTFHTRYIPQYGKALKPNGFVYPSYSLCGTNTGRPNSKDPNLLNLPKHSPIAHLIRGCVEAPEGWTIVAADASNAELRWLAHVSQDPVMLCVFRNGGDMHVTTAEKVLKIDLSTLSKDDYKRARQRSKPINFGYAYGQTPKGFVNYAKAGYRVNFTLEEATKFQQEYFNTYRGMKVYHQKYISHAHKFKYVDSPLGRRRHLPAIDSEDPYLRGEAERQAINCVDAETEVLTIHGWKYYHEISKETIILTKNIDTNMLEWQKIQKLNVYPNYKGPVVEITCKAFSAIVTPNHNWMVTSRDADGTKFNRLVRTEDLKLYGHDVIHRNGLYAGVKSKEWSDDEVELIGWILTDSSYPKGCVGKSGKRYKTSIIRIGQSEKGNPDKVAEIDDLLQRMSFHHKRYVYNNCVYWLISGDRSQDLKDEFPERVLTMKFLVSLTKTQLKLLYETMLKGDGHREKKNRKEVFMAGTKHKIDMFSILVTLLGYGTSTKYLDLSKIKQKKYDSMGNIPNMNGVWKLTKHFSNTVRLLPKHIKKYVSKQLMWCPTVSNGTFVARRNGFSYITGNSPIQGSSSDTCLIAAGELKRKKIIDTEKAKLFLFTYDELCYLVKDGYEMEAAQAVKHAMENVDFRPFGFEMSIPLESDVKIGKNLAEMKEIKL